MQKPIEFHDFVFDYYTFLGIPNNAPRREIARRIAKIRADNHPDGLERRSPDVQAMCQQQWDMAQRCEEVLLNDTLRPLFDARLQEFKDEKRPVYAKRYPSIMFGIDTDRIDIDYLVGTNRFSLAKAKETARMVSGYSETTFAQAERLYALDQTNADITQIFRHALHQKLAYLLSLEKDLWQIAGVNGKQHIPNHDEIVNAQLIGDEVRAKIIHIIDDVIPAQLIQNTTMKQLGFEDKPTLLLTTSVPATFNPLTLPDQGEKIKAAQQNFAVLSQAIQTNAEQRAQVTAALLDLTPTETLHQANSDIIIIHALKNDQDAADIRAAKVINSTVFTRHSGGYTVADTVDYVGYSLADLKDKTTRVTSYAILLDPLIPQLRLHLGHALNKALQQLGISVTLNANIIAEEPTNQQRPTTTMPGNSTAEASSLLPK
jgi:hypothetical protein